MEPFETSRKEGVVTQLINYAFSEVERKYGKGVGDGETPKSYHNLLHTKEVLTAAQQIAKKALEAGKIGVADIPLIEIAASFHDIEQDLGSGNNERESARIAAEEMRKIGLKDEDVQKVKRMILATTVFFENGVMKQSATDDYLTQVLADADLSNLGQEPQFYWERAQNLLREVGFIGEQASFLENHRFYTEEAKRLFPHKKENIRYVQTKQ